MTTEQGAENGATGDDASAKVTPNPVVPKLVIELANDEGGTDRGEFLAFAKANQWALMRNAEAAKSGKVTDQLASVYNLAMSSLPPGPPRVEFDTFMLTHGQDEDLEEKLTAALLALWNGETRLPLVPTSSDSSTSTGESEPTSTDVSSEPASSPAPQEPLILPAQGVVIYPQTGWPMEASMTATGLPVGSSTPDSTSEAS